MQIEFVFVQTVIAWLFILWGLPKLKDVNSITANTWLFLVLFSLAITLQVEAVDTAVNIWIANHVGWFLTYAIGLIALYCIYRAIYLVLKLDKPLLSKQVYAGLVLVLVSMLLLFPAITIQPPGTFLKDATDNIWILLFLFIPHFYASAICWILYRMFCQCYQAANDLPMRIRWGALAVSLFFAAVYFGAHIPYFVALFLYPALKYSPMAKTFHQLLAPLSVVRISWVLFFVPNKVYKVICAPFIFWDKLITLKHLERLRVEANTLLSRTELLTLKYSWWESLKNLDFLIYRAIISILDVKKRLNDPDEPFTYPQILFLKQTLNMVQDDASFDLLVLAYRKASTQYHKQIGSRQLI